MRLGQHLARDLPKPIALPAPPCICRDRKIQTPISAMKGSQETSSDTNHGTLSPGGFAGDRDLAVIEALDQRRVARRVGLEARAIGEGAVNLLALMTTSRTWFWSTSVQQLRERDILRGGALDPGSGRAVNNASSNRTMMNPEGEVAQIGVH